MSVIKSFARKLKSAARGLVFRNATERDLNDEISLHLDLETDRLMREGVDATEARRRAMIAFGGVEVAREAHRDGRGSRWVEELVADTRHAFRALRRAPTHAFTAIATLGLGIGATTAIVAVVNQVIVRPLPFNKPDRLVMMWEENPDRAWKLNTLSPANYLDLKERVTAFETAGAWLDFQSDVSLTGNGEPRQATSVGVTGDLFTTLGVNPLVGRTFRAEETWDTGARLVMLSHRLWRDRFGSNKDIVGQSIQINERSYEVVGVLPATFRIPGLDPDIWTPARFPAASKPLPSFRRAHYLRGVARLRPGVSVAQANAQMRTVMSTLEKDYPATNTHMAAGISPLHEFLVGDTRRPLLMLLSAVAVLLLIACVNVGNLVLVQAAARQREIALRLALGAKRFRLIRQSLTESVVLALLGGTVGIAIGWAGIRALASLQPAGMLPPGSITIEWTTVAFVFAVATVTGLLFGVAPALWQSHRLPVEMLKEGGRGGTSKRMQSWTSALVVSEVAMAVTLTLGAGLLVRSYWKLQQTNPGYRADGVITMALTLPSVTYDSTRKVSAFFDQLATRAQALPGVNVAAYVSQLPSTRFSWSSDFAVQGAERDIGVTDVVHREISPGYQSVMQIKLTKGRLFNDGDNSEAPSVVLINDELARKFFPNEDPIGKRIAFDRVPDSTSVWRTIVGIVGSERQASIATQPRPEIFAPVAQDVRRSLSLVVRTSGDPLTLASSLRRVVAEIDPNLPIASLRSMTDVRAEAVGRERFLTTLLLSFASVGMVLALVGVYGVMAQLTRGRLREMGIRLALGAPVAGIQWLVLRRGLSLTAIGLLLGLVAASLASGTITTLLYDVNPLDALTFVVVPISILICASMASWLPARRASQVDPTVTLREE